MRFGCCITPEYIKWAERLAYDYVELPAAALKLGLSELEALPYLREITSAHVRPEVFNLLVPPELPMVGRDVDQKRLRKYFHELFKRMGQVGGLRAILGSGRARAIPGDMTKERGIQQLALAVTITAEEADKAGIVVAIEPLNRQESNVLNSLSESFNFLRDHNLTALGLAVDLYHLETEGEPLAAVKTVGHLLLHSHVASYDRSAPRLGTCQVGEFMEVLRECGYDQRMSAECLWANFSQEAAETIAFMRDQWSHKA